MDNLEISIKDTNPLESFPLDSVMFVINGGGSNPIPEMYIIPRKNFFKPIPQTGGVTLGYEWFKSRENKSWMMLYEDSVSKLVVHGSISLKNGKVPDYCNVTEVITFKW